MASAVSEANRLAASRLMKSESWLVDVLPARKAIGACRRGVYLHAGPPLTVEEMAEPMKLALAGAQVYEGEADSAQEGLRKLERGDLAVAPAHDNDAIAPMTGVVSSSMPVFVVKNRTFGNQVCTNVNEGVGKTKTMRFGAFNKEVLARLEWIRDTLAPALRDAVHESSGVDLRQITAEALRRGDECHNRNKSASLILFRKIALSLARAGYGGRRLSQALGFIGSNEHFFLNLSMANAKASLDAAQGVRRSSLVTAMSANGKDFAIRVSGLGKARPPYSWFRAPVPPVKGRYFRPYSSRDACGVIGDSFITECTGLGAFSMAAAPAITEFVGGSARWALGVTMKMYSITEAEHSHYKIPYLGYRGVPTGIDVGRVLRSGTFPAMNLGIAHRRAGIGQIGAGFFRAPRGCFVAAGESFRSTYGVSLAPRIP